MVLELTKYKKIFKYIFLFIIICSIVCGAIVFQRLFQSPNSQQMKNEIKAYFKPTVYLDYNPCIDEIGKIKIGGTISMSYYDEMENRNAVYTNLHNIDKVTNYLKSIPLVNADKNELPNMSPDSYIQYYDKDGNQIKNLIIFGKTFIKDVDSNKIYKIKYNGAKVLKKLEKLKM